MVGVQSNSRTSKLLWTYPDRIWRYFWRTDVADESHELMEGARTFSGIRRSVYAQGNDALQIVGSLASQEILLIFKTLVIILQRA